MDVDAIWTRAKTLKLLSGSLRALVTHYEKREGGRDCQIKTDIVSVHICLSLSL